MKNRTLVSALCGAALLATAPSASAQFAAPQPSPGAKVSQAIGASEVAVSYSRPSVKGPTGKRTAIWGDLVPWDKPWRAGANDATTVTFSDEVLVEGQKLDTGTY